MTTVTALCSPLFTQKAYVEFLESEIQRILTRPSSVKMTFDLLDTPKIKERKLAALREKQRLMKVGEIWQVALGNYNNCTNLKQGHETKLDILSESRHFAIELKNRTNTDNASSKKTNYDKLANFKKNNPDYTCIYACINASTEKETLRGYVKQEIHDGEEILVMVGREFLEFILGDDTDFVIDFIRTTIEKYALN